tara:strand:+ start:1422 stop:3059 length:1638 start_codon:yes stop_codon:yes gene_type:complete
MRNLTNPKKIKGQDKLNRIKDLMGKMNTINESDSTSEVELIKKGANGVVYGIVRENRDYFIKTSEKTSGEFIAEDFNYVGGLQNKSSEKYKSYADALKHLNLKFDMLNESFGVEKNTNLFETDGVAFSGGAGFGFVLPEEEVKEPEVIEDQKKVIKVDAPAAEAPVEDEVEVDMGGDMADVEFEGEDEEIEVDAEDEDEGDSYTKKIQKLTGKVAQMLRDKDEPDAELDKYVINSIVAAIDWEEIPDEDVEDIIAKIEGEDEEDDALAGDDEETVEVDFDEEEEVEGEEELAESEEKAEEKSIKTLETALKQHEDAVIDLKKEIKDLKQDEEVEEKEEKNESRTFSKKQLMESFLKKNANLALKKVLTEKHTICEECLGKGCKSCEDHGDHGEHEEWASLDEDLNITNTTALEAGDDVGFAPQPFGEQEMNVVDAIATGQDFLAATGDLDRDGDDIPNRLDMDNDGDGEVDQDTFASNDYIEIDFESLFGNAPVKEPGIKEPTTRPGTKPKKPRWKKIPRPSVNPKPKALKERKKPTIKRNGMYK